MKVGLVVPEVRLLGGIQKHAEFVLGVLESLRDVEVELASLAISSRDSSSVRILDPRTWSIGVSQEPVRLGGRAGTHFGCRMSEIETQRFRKRAALSDFVVRQDLVSVVAGAPSWAVPVSGLGVPIVLTFATLTSLERASLIRSRWSPENIYRSYMTRRVSELDDRGIRASDFVVTENRIMYEHAVARKGSAAVLYAPPGVDTERFTPAHRRRFDEGYFLFVGRARDPRKNFPLLIAAYCELIKRVPDAPRLVVAGIEPPEPETLAKVPGDRVSVVLRPSDEKLASLYREAVASILTSDEEGFGLVVVEAMASGVPVVATRCGGPEEIITDEVDGFLVDCGDVAGLARRLEDLACNRDNNLKMGSMARTTAESKFSLTATRVCHRSLYERILSDLSHVRLICS